MIIFPHFSDIDLAVWADLTVGAFCHPLNIQSQLEIENEEIGKRDATGTGSERFGKSPLPLFSKRETGQEFQKIPLIPLLWRNHKSRFYRTRIRVTGLECAEAMQKQNSRAFGSPLLSFMAGWSSRSLFSPF
jgi:hypothetical protein